jgi:hypothetical protein
MRLRSLLWLVVAALFVLPSLAAPVAAIGQAAHPVAEHCGHDAPPPPPPCPDQDTAKHAAAVCCPLMAGAVALLPAELGLSRSQPDPFAPGNARDLVGLSPHQDPPPPRV